ncbi:MAG: bifunctional precorrin-2 dehydrogenase/sirohydrochlorin ferrochelatase [bacterium]
MKYYNLELNIKNKKCVVVGGGDIAYRKVLSLLECGAKVHVVSKKLNEELRVFFKENKICSHENKICSHKNKIYFHEKEYQTKDLKGAFLVIGATNCLKTNEKIAKDAHKLRILVNIVDNIKLCNYIVPAVTKRGDLVISVSTAGKSPFLAKKIKDEIAKLYGQEYGELVNILGSIRKKVIQEVSDPQKRRLVWEGVVSSKTIEYLKEGNLDKVNNLIKKVIEEGKRQ